MTTGSPPERAERKLQRFDPEPDLDNANVGNSEFSGTDLEQMIDGRPGWAPVFLCGWADRAGGDFRGGADARKPRGKDLLGKLADRHYLSGKL